MSRILNISNINKTIRYFKKNGIVNTYYASLERIQLKRKSPYTYIALSEDELSRQREHSKTILASQNQESAKCQENVKIQENTIKPPFITVVMPTYETPETFLREAIESVITQTYGNWEFIIADASSTDSVEKIVEEYIKNVAREEAFTRTEAVTKTEDATRRDDITGIDANIGCIRYIRLEENKGISDNTNVGIKEAKGDYIALLDHDDLYTPNALYEMAIEIISYAKKHNGELPEMLYSDEDKLDSDSGQFFDLHQKYNFNYDLLLTNNYICHLLMVKAEMFDKIRLRKEFDGAQDYDLVLQITRALVKEKNVCIPRLNEHIIHVNKVLYHWRSHVNSTAANTDSKLYAYEAGLRALEEHIKLMHEQETDRQEIRGKEAGSQEIRIFHSKHLGFYTIKWGAKPEDIFKYRPEVGAIIGRVLDKSGRMSRCIQNEAGEWLYEGINKHFAGELNRFDCAQDVYYADSEHMIRRPGLNSEYDSDRLREEGYLITYIPEL